MAGVAGAAVTRPTLTERRKAATRLDIARAAAELFTRDGLRATRAEDIARAAGVAPRTFYRYFATKEESVAPLLDAGAHQWAEAVREAPVPLPVPAALRYAVERALSGDDEATLLWVRALLRLTDESPALRAVWADTCRVSESTLLTTLVDRAGAGPTPTCRCACSRAWRPRRCGWRWRRGRARRPHPRVRVARRRWHWSA